MFPLFGCRLTFSSLQDFDSSWIESSTEGLSSKPQLCVLSKSIGGWSFWDPLKLWPVRPGLQRLAVSFKGQYRWSTTPCKWFCWVLPIPNPVCTSLKLTANVPQIMVRYLASFVSWQPVGFRDSFGSLLDFCVSSFPFCRLCFWPLNHAHFRKATTRIFDHKPFFSLRVGLRCRKGHSPCWSAAHGRLFAWYWQSCSARGEACMRFF